jgi:hypothetical protein
MKNKNKINENSNAIDISLTAKDMSELDPNTVGELKKAAEKGTINLKFSKDKKGIESLFTEVDAVIEPQDQATIKYLSNIVDANTGEVSNPFTIADKNYQMVRGITPSKEVVMAVYCLDDMDDQGNNIIHSIEEFEKNIAMPMKEKLEREGKQVNSESKDDTYEGYKHFLVNKKTNEVRKFKTIEEMLSCNKIEEEEYMSTTRFKKHMTEKLFGKRNKITEIDEPSDDELTGKAKLLIQKMDEIYVIKNAMDSVNQQGTDKAKGIVLVAFAERIGVPKNKLSTIINSIKAIAKEPVPQQQGITEGKTITKKELMESLSNKKKVIKTVKVKDIK